MSKTLRQMQADVMGAPEELAVEYQDINENWVVDDCPAWDWPHLVYRIAWTKENILKLLHPKAKCGYALIQNNGEAYTCDHKTNFVNGRWNVELCECTYLDNFWHFHDPENSMICLQEEKKRVPLTHEDVKCGMLIRRKIDSEYDHYMITGVHKYGVVVGEEIIYYKDLAEHWLNHETGEPMSKEVDA